MRPYYYDDIPGSIRLPHDSGIPVDTKVVTGLGLHHTYVAVPDSIPEEGWPEINDIAKEREYVLRDWLTVTKECLGDKYEAKLDAFYSEHMHEEEEIRYVVQGGGYFDVREHPTDRWIRCKLDPGDLMVVPPGIYHRFILDDRNMLKALMLFKEPPRWSYHHRGDASEVNSYRLDYLKSIEVH